MSPNLASSFLAPFLLASCTIAAAGTLYLPAKTYSPGGANGPTGVAVADVNGDGKPDLLVASGTDYSGSPPNGSVGVLLGDGDGTFQPAQTYDSGGAFATSITVADVNGDGKLDLLVATACATENSCVGVLLGNGDGTFQAAHTYVSGQANNDTTIAVADVNGDGIADLVVGDVCANSSCTLGVVALLLGNGDGTFQAMRTYDSGGFSWSIAVADVNGDGKPDIVVANLCPQGICLGSEGMVGVLVGNGDGTFQPAKTYDSGGSGPVSVAIADINKDGWPDLLVANLFISLSGNVPGNVGGVAILLGNGDGTFQPAKTYLSGGYHASSIAVSDVNGDGNIDLLVANQCITVSCTSQGGIGILLGNGDGTFQTTQLYPAGPQTFAIAVADLNRDGRPDLVVANGRTCGGNCEGSVSVLLRRVYTTSTKLTLSPNPSFINQAVTFTAKVTSLFGAIPDGEVITFYIDSNNVGTGTTASGMATFTTSTLSRGSHTIKASYSGDFNFKPSPVLATQAVNLYPSTTSLSSMPNPSSFGQTVKLTATVTTPAPLAPTGIVNFKNGTTSIGTAAVSGGVAVFSTTKLPRGTLSLTATYTGDTQSVKSTSPPVTQTVN